MSEAGPDSFCYVLDRTESGWAWRLIDENGDAVLRGLNSDLAGATAAIQRAMANISRGLFAPV